jgi:hypothetical protein
MRATRGRGVGTPDLAQQAGVRSKCQRQHDRKESCSKHVILVTSKGKTHANQKGGGDLRKLRILSRLSVAGQKDLRNFAGQCRKLHSASRCDTAQLAGSIPCTRVLNLERTPWGCCPIQHISERRTSPPPIPTGTRAALHELLLRVEPP